MCSILETLQFYVPLLRTEQLVPSPESSEFDTVITDRFHPILVGGDQLTCARARGAQRIRQTHDTGSQRLEGLVPVVEDWHAKQCLLGVSPYNL